MYRCSKITVCAPEGLWECAGGREGHGMNMGRDG